MTPAYSIDVARRGDMAACATILNRWIDETEWMPRIHLADAVISYYEEEVFAKRKVFVAKADQTIAGFAAVDEAALVTALYVDRSNRRQGVGSLLIDHLKILMPARLRLWTFQNNLLAQKFYARHGFVEINRTDGDNEEGLPDILMEWRAQ
jgi:GNAT superfamily N-acetyltransferase